MKTQEEDTELVCAGTQVQDKSFVSKNEFCSIIMKVELVNFVHPSIFLSQLLLPVHVAVRVLITIKKISFQRNKGNYDPIKTAPPVERRC